MYALENLYSHEGTPGHEIVFVFEAELAGSDSDSKVGFLFFDDAVTNEAAWRPVRELVTGVARLFPEKLIGYLTAKVNFCR